MATVKPNKKFDPKDPDEVLDYDWDWEVKFGGEDTILTSQFIVEGPDTALVIGTGNQVPTYTQTRSKIWLSSGTLGKTYKITNRVTTALGRTMDWTGTLPIRSK